MGGSGGPCVYRESWLKAVGYDSVPTDTDKFLDLCRKLKASGHPAGFTTGHAVGDGNAYCYWLVWAFGGKMVDENQKVTINSKETVEALKYGKALYETFIPGTQSWLDPSNNKALIAGDISMTQNGVSLYFSIKNSPDPKIAAMAADLNHARMPIGPVGRADRIRAGDQRHGVQAQQVPERGQGLPGLHDGGAAIRQMADRQLRLLGPAAEGVRRQRGLDQRPEDRRLQGHHAGQPLAGLRRPDQRGVRRRPSPTTSWWTWSRR